MKRLCKIEGCESPRVEGAFLCTKHLGERRRCEGIVHTYDPETGEVLSERQCKRSARRGNTTCTSHGANSPAALKAARTAEAYTALERFVKPYEGDLSPISAFENEFRRTYGRILWLEEQIAALKDDELIWGITKEEHLNANEFPGVNKTYEARVHLFEEMLWKERKHYHELIKTAIRTNLDERKLSMMRSHIDYTYALVIKAAQALGHDTTSPEVRDIIGRLFERELTNVNVAIESSGT